MRRVEYYLRLPPPPVRLQRAERLAPEERDEFIDLDDELLDEPDLLQFFVPLEFLPDCEVEGLVDARFDDEALFDDDALLLLDVEALFEPVAPFEARPLCEIEGRDPP